MQPHHREPDILRNLRTELVEWRSWLDRVVALAAAAAAGLLVVGFTLLTSQALHLFTRLWQQAPWALLLTGPPCVAAIVYVTRRWLPGAGGSGIPQVMAALDTATPPERCGLFVSLRISVAKVLLSSAGLLAGLSIGRLRERGRGEGRGTPLRRQGSKGAALTPASLPLRG